MKQPISLYFAGKDKVYIDFCSNEVDSAIKNNSVIGFINFYRSAYKSAQRHDKAIKGTELEEFTQLKNWPVLPYRKALKLQNLKTMASDGIFFEECTEQEAELNRIKIREFFSWYIDYKYNLI